MNEEGNDEEEFKAHMNARQVQPGLAHLQYSFTNEFCLLYFNSRTFIDAFSSGRLRRQMQHVKDFVSRAKGREEQDSYKVVVLFNSVSDSLFGNQGAFEPVVQQEEETKNRDPTL